jgi:hypothetical protein
MQRRAALDALVQRRSGAVAALAEKLAQDPYPRVRAGALGPLVATDQRELVEQLVARDPWPLVRVEAVRALAQAGSEGQSALEGALDDPARSVRQAAIEGLRRAGLSGAWAKIAPHLSAQSEAVEVREAAIGFARSSCLVEARGPLLALARRLLSPGASEEETHLAVEALRALHELGGDAARDGSQVVEQAKTPALTKLWARLAPARCDVPHQS